MTGHVWAPGAAFLRHDHGIGEQIAHVVMRAATWRVLWSLPLWLAAAAGGVAVLVLVAGRRRGGRR